jgi:transposase
MGFHDETGLSERPFIHRTWARKGKTPVITSSGSWKKLALSGVIVTDPMGRSPRFLLRSIAGSVDAKEVIRFLKDIKRHLQGRKLLLFMDGLPAHRAKLVQRYIRSERSWLRVIRLPAYAPELNPIEYLWGMMKKTYLANLAPELTVIGRELKRCRPKMSDRRLLQGFLKASGLYS